MSHAKPSQCPSQIRPQHAYSTSTKKAYSVPCSKWSCSFCGWRKQQVATYLVAAGMGEAQKRGERLRFMTLTEDPNRPLDVAGLSKCWNRLRTELKQKNLLNEYAAAFEVTKKGRPHLHVLFSGSFIHQMKLSRWAERVGFGRVTDIRAVGFDLAGDDLRSASYIAKEMAGYVSKSKGATAGKLVAQRRRPLRTSRGWYPGGMKRAEAELLAEVRDEDKTDKGPFWFVLGDPAETLVIQGTRANGEKWRLRDFPTTSQPEVEEVSSEAERRAARAKLRETPSEAERWDEAA